VSATFTETLWFHDLSPFVSATFKICVHDFPSGEVSAKVSVMEFGLYQQRNEAQTNSACRLDNQTQDALEQTDRQTDSAVIGKLSWQQQQQQ